MKFLFAVFLIVVWVQASSGEEKQWLFQSEAKWDREWKSGEWKYLDKVAVERSRIAVIGGVLVQLYSTFNSSVLDIGCGEGPIADFLTPSQKARYVGVDISGEAIHNAKKLRGSPMKFVHSAAHQFHPVNKFDVIIFSDVLYYVEYEKVLQQYLSFLNPSGIMIISIFHQTQQLMYENIFSHARQVMNKIDEMEISGFTRKGKSTKLEQTAFHVEVYQKKMG